MKKTILLVDDEPHILRAAEIKLTRAGFSVQCAGDGFQALELIAASKPDLLVTDLQMPRMDGFELSRKVRENAATADIPIFLLTAKGMEDSLKAAAAELQVLAVLPKPFSPRELVRSIEQALGVKPIVCAPLAHLHAAIQPTESPSA